ADTLAHVVLDDGAAIAAIRNPLPARGGRAPESWRSVRREAPQAFRKPARAVTPDDYARAAAEHPDVVRAYATRRWWGSWHVVTLALDRLGGAPVDRAFQAEILAFLEARRLAGHDLAIAATAFAPLDLAFHVCVKPQADTAAVARALDLLFSARAGGLFHPDALDFGADVALSPLIAAAMGVPGVAWIGLFDAKGVRRGHFRRLDRPGIDYDAEGVIPVAEGEIARLDNDPNFPDRGRVRFEIDGGRRA
ncbi:MAG: baseplate J/gp47 family protein, partial [Roseicyclus sp.]